MTDSELTAIEARATRAMTLGLEGSDGREALACIDDIPALIAEVRRLKEHIDELRHNAIERGERD